VPRAIPHHQRALVSGLEAVELTADNRPLLVGERTNVLGSRAFKGKIAGGDFEAAAEIGRAQVRSGAQVLDVCLQDPDRDELSDVESFLDRLTRVVKAPLMLDSTDAQVMGGAHGARASRCSTRSTWRGWRVSGGRAARPRFGAAFVVGLIDERGWRSRSAQARVAAAAPLLTRSSPCPEDIWWDPLVFPCATGAENYLGSAGLTIAGVRALKSEFPLTKTVLGISNVSFGLPTAGREVLNSVFLYHATQAGLDAAIVNSERLARFAEIPEEERALAEALIFLNPGEKTAGERAVAAFAERFRGRSAKPAGAPRAAMPLDERLSRAIVEERRSDWKRIFRGPVRFRHGDPLSIINGPLMRE
jgi:5-methyltetrahydrofolate--homocysteine methyltransferase